MKSIFELIDLNHDINDVKLKSELGYSLVFADYGVLSDNDFLEVMIGLLPKKSSFIRLIFFDFVGINQLEIRQDMKIDLMQDDDGIASSLYDIRQKYLSSFGGTTSSRYVILDESLDFVIVVEDSVPLSKIYFKEDMTYKIKSKLLDDYTFV